MRITQIEYRALKSGPGYNNTTIGATTLVESGEDPQAVLDDLRQWVGTELDLEQAIRDRRAEIQQLDYKIRIRKDDLAAVETQRIAAIRALGGLVPDAPAPAARPQQRSDDATDEVPWE